MRDKEKTLETWKAQAVADGEPLSDHVIKLLKVVIDIEDKAYMADYEKGFDDGYEKGMEEAALK